MDYRDAYRAYDRTGGADDVAASFKHPMEDAFDRSRKRGRSPSPSFDRYASERRASAYGAYPPTAAAVAVAPVDAWDRERDFTPAALGADTAPYAGPRGVYDEYARDDYDRERERALEWERYYRERDSSYGDDYAAPDRDRYGARRRYDDDGRDDRYPRERDRGFAAYGNPAAAETPQRRNGPDYTRDGGAGGSDAGGAYRNGGEPAAPPDPLQSDTLLPFRIYAQMTRAAHPSARDRTIDQPSTQELYEGYQEYRLAFQKRAMQAFFERRKEEAWFKEKYNVAEDYASARQKRKRAGRLGRKEAWLEELASGKLDHVNFDLKIATEASSSLLSSTADASVTRADGGRDETGSRNAEAHEDADPDGRDGRDGRDERPPRRRAESVRLGDPVLTTRYGELEPVPNEQVPIPPSEHQILIKSFPPDISRAKLEAHFESRPRFRYLAIGEPHSGKRWHRVGWAIYEEGTDMDETVRALDAKDVDGFTLHLTVSARSTQGKLRSVPEYANSFARLIQDLKQVKALVAKLEHEDRTALFREEAEREAEAEGGNAWLQINASDAIMARHREVEPDVGDDDAFEEGYDADEDASTREARRARLKKHLDWHLDLLRTVYHCDYYLSLVCEFQEELLRRSPRHARRQPPAGAMTHFEVPRDNTNDESWAKSVDQKTALLLSDEKADLTEFGGKSIDAEMMAAALAFVKEEEKEKHRCIVEVAGAQCGKLFKAAIFVQKHVLNKHRAFLEGQTDQSIQETRFFNNFVRDPCRPQAPAGQPITGAGGGGERAAGTPLAHRFGTEASPAMPSPLFNSSRVGLIRLGGSTAAVDSPVPPSNVPYGRRGTSPSRWLGERIGGVVSPPGAGAPMSGGGVLGGGGYASPSSTSLGMRIGGLASNGGVGAGAGAGGDSAERRSETVKMTAEPLPDPPKPLDPRAARSAPKSYTDLDGPAAQGDVDDLAY